MKLILSVLLIGIAATTCAQTQAEMNQQSSAEYKRVDAEMAALYKKALSKFATDKTRKQLLINAQRAWIRYKEAHCKADAGSYVGGSMYPMVYVNCMTDITNARIEQLQKLFLPSR